MNFPLVQPLPFRDPLQVLGAFSTQEGTILFHSASTPSSSCRYSYLMTDPWQILSSHKGTTRINGQTYQEKFFDVLQGELSRYPLPLKTGLPAFQGGAAGYLGYEAAHLLENLPTAPTDEFDMPEAWFGFYDTVIAFDHLEKQSFIFSSGFPETEEEARFKRAQQRLDYFSHCVQDLPPVKEKNWSPVKITSDVSCQDYCAQVQKIIDYIYAGDIYQANYSRRLRTRVPEGITAYDVYQQLAIVNPAPFAGYLHTAQGIIASASPERFLKVEQGQVETKPIKGTRRRSINPLEDKQAAQELLESEKDQAENIMIVDLMRNDLSRVCQPHSVKVPQLLALESYATVHHLVSTVVGTLSPSFTAVDLLKATFPGGSITGAPKIRSMEIITELEQETRGPFYGSMGYIGFAGQMDSNILIRTFVIQGAKVLFQVGGGIVADSDPLQEYEESTTKALSMIKALRGML